MHLNFSYSLVGLWFLLISSSLFSQERFNIRYEPDHPSVLFGSVIELPDGYGVTGVLADSVETVNGRPMTFVKFDFEGEYEFHKSYGGLVNGPDRWLNTINDDLIYLNDSTLINSSRSIDTNNILQYILFKYNLDGDTLISYRNYSPTIEQDDWAGITQVVKSTDGNLLLQVYNSTGFFGQAGDFFIEKMTPEGESLWQYLYSTSDPYDLNWALIPTESGGAIIIPVVPEPIQWEDDWIHHRIIELNDSGEVIHDTLIEFDYRIGGIRRSIMDNNFIICPVCIESTDPDDRCVPSLLKMDMDGNEEWHEPAWEPDYNLRHVGNKVLLTHDEQYLLGGEYSQDIEGGAFNWYEMSAFLAKYSTEGEVQWLRKYTFLDSFRYHHSLNDLEPTSDGGYIFCGEARDDSDDAIAPIQQGWLVKVDEFGCLVEGCEQYDNVEEQEQSESYFKAGPIPASDFLNVFQIKALDSSYYFELTDLKGNTVESFPAVATQNTFMIPVYNYSSGSYVLSLRKDGRVLQSEKVIVN